MAVCRSFKAVLDPVPRHPLSPSPRGACLGPGTLRAQPARGAWEPPLSREAAGARPRPPPTPRASRNTRLRRREEPAPRSPGDQARGRKRRHHVEPAAGPAGPLVGRPRTHAALGENKEEGGGGSEKGCGPKRGPPRREGNIERRASAPSPG